MKAFIRKNFYYILAFLIPFLTLTAAFIVIGVYPFGDRSILIIDSYHQYAPFFSELRDKVLSGESLFYSWNGGLGINFLAIIAYYLASPFNIVAFIFPRGLLLEAFTLIIMLKISLSGVTFAYYIRKRYNRYNITIVYFAVFYALSGWMIGYNWNIMWLDCVILLPLVLLGLERLVKEGKGLLYGVTLGISILCNYYISIMICIFACIYFFIVFLEQKKISIGLFFRRGFKFAAYSLLGGGLSAVLLLPTYYALMATHSAEASFPKEAKFNSNIFDLISRHFTVVEPTSLNGKPNLYCGVIALLLIFLYIFHKGLLKRQKILRIGLLAFLLLSCSLNMLDYIWHGFHYPNSLPNRFTFIYIFVLLTICYEVFTCLHKFRNWQYMGAFIGVSLFIIGSYLFGEAEHETYTYIVTMVIICIYFILICVLKTNWHKRKLIKNIISIVLLIEVVGNGIYGFCMNGSVNRTTYNNDLEDAREILALTEAREEDFYRMELDQVTGRNNVMWLGFPGFSMFSSTLSDELDTMVDGLGFFAATNKFSYVGATPLTDSIFGIRYLAAKGQLRTSRSFKLLNQVGGKYLYENPYALGLGFIVKEDYLTWNYNLERPDFVLNDLVYLASGIYAPLFSERQMREPIAEGCNLSLKEEGHYSYSLTNESKVSKVTYEVNAEESGLYYVYYEASNSDKLVVSVDGDSKSYSDTRGHMVELGYLSHGTTATLEFTLDEEKSTGKIKAYLFKYNEEVMDMFYDYASENQWELTTFETAHLVGTVHADENSVLFTSIPYDEGWTITVDGIETEPSDLNQALLAIPLTEGDHVIEMKYTPKGFIFGLVISCLSLLIFVTIYLLTRNQVVKNS